RVDEEMNRAAGARVVIVNLCLALFLLPLPSLVRVTTSLLGLAGLSAFLVLLGRALWVRRRLEREGSGEVIAATLRTGPPPVPRRLGVLHGVGAVALAVVLGVAGDPAAAGLAGADADDGVAATGRTTTVRVEARDMRFVPDVIEVPVGDRLVVELVNTDDVHDLVLDNGARSGRLSAGESAEIDLGVVGRDVEGWCSVAGHRQMGMTLDVVAVGAVGAGDVTADDEAASSGLSHHHGTDRPARAGLDLLAEPGPGFAAHPAELPPAPEADVPEPPLPVTEV